MQNIGTDDNGKPVTLGDLINPTPCGQREFTGCKLEGIMKTGVEQISAERARQVAEEGWTKEHDAQHDKWEIPRAARCYTLPLVSSTTPCRPDWPWHENWWKPSDDPVRNLVKAGALIAAEIDRLQAEQASVSTELTGCKAKRGKDMFNGRNLTVENLDVDDDWTKILENSLPYRKERHDT